MSDTPLSDFAAVRMDPAVSLRVPAALALRRLALPLCVLDGAVVVAMADPADQAAAEAVSKAVGRPVRPLRAEPAALREQLLRVYGDGRADASRPASPSAEGDPVSLLDGLLRTALLRHASDIHFDPEAASTRVRMRLDGDLEEVLRIPAALQPSVCSRLKVLAGLDIAERRAPQDGGFTWRMPGAQARLWPPVDVRMATLPVRHGERITLRLLETDAGRFTLDRLGLAPADHAALSDILAEPHGLVLLTGPTGSGKTTTLHAAIRELLAREPLNILTVEDPIEYEIPGVSQAEVDSSDKVNFAKALRSLLRHDPDVIMIGEIRDAESLDTAVKAALTGHLVLSTLHANDAVGAVTRLFDMGLAPHLAAATLRLSVAQRLVRALCPACRARRAATEAECAALDLPTDASVCDPVGCLACAGRGTLGRRGLFEFFRPDAEIASRIAAGAREDALRTLARAKGARSLLQDAATKCLAGDVAPRDCLRVLG